MSVIVAVASVLNLQAERRVGLMELPQGHRAHRRDMRDMWGMWDFKLKLTGCYAESAGPAKPVFSKQCFSGLLIVGPAKQFLSQQTGCNAESDGLLTVGPANQFFSKRCFAWPIFSVFQDWAVVERINCQQLQKAMDMLFGFDCVALRPSGWCEFRDHDSDAQVTCRFQNTG